MNYLRVLTEKFDGGPVGLNTIAVALSEDEVTEQFFRLLRREGPGARALVLGGDIFDLWVARPALELPVHRAFMRVIEELDAQGVPVLYVQGNRDYFVTDQYGTGPFSEVGVGQQAVQLQS